MKNSKQQKQQLSTTTKVFLTMLFYVPVIGWVYAAFILVPGLMEMALTENGYESILILFIMLLALIVYINIVRHWKFTLWKKD